MCSIFFGRKFQKKVCYFFHNEIHYGHLKTCIPVVVGVFKPKKPHYSVDQKLEPLLKLVRLCYVFICVARKSQDNKELMNSSSRTTMLLLHYNPVGRTISKLRESYADFSR